METMPCTWTMSNMGKLRACLLHAEQRWSKGWKVLLFYTVCEDLRLQQKALRSRNSKLEKRGQQSQRPECDMNLRESTDFNSSRRRRLLLSWAVTRTFFVKFYFGARNNKNLRKMKLLLLLWLLMLITSWCSQRATQKSSLFFFL